MKWIKISENPQQDWAIKRYIVAGIYPDGKKFIGSAMRINGEWDSADYNPKWFTHYAFFEDLPLPLED